MKKNLVVLSFLGISMMSAAQLPYQNPNLSSQQRAEDLASRLTLEEKASLMCDVSPAVTRLGIKPFNWWSEALHGYASNNGITCYPEPIAMAASFDDATLYKVFSTVSDEARALHNERIKKGETDTRFHGLSVWTPNVNIFRDPRWGRGQETYGEDPYLTSRMGIQVVRGLQGPEDSKYKKLLACAKHYAVHSGPESTRHVANISDLDPRDLWETYLPAFKALVQEADVQEVMCAYQRLDDEPCCGNNRLLQQILRDEWGFKHLVVSDCGAVSDIWQSHKVSSDAVHAATKGTLAGTDVECGFGYTYASIPKAVQKGLITEEEVNKHVIRLLKARFDLGEMDDSSLVPWTNIPKSVVDCDEHRQLATKIAQESMTLLQNKDNILPLNKNIKKIAVIGPNADNERMMWGNYNGEPSRTTTILAGIRNKIGANKVKYEKICDVVNDKVNETLIPQCSIDGKAGIKATYWNNTTLSGAAVNTDQINKPMQLTTLGQHPFSDGVSLKNFSAKYETEFKAQTSEEIYIKVEATGSFKLSVNGETKSRFGNWRSVPTRIPLTVEAGKTYKIEAEYRYTSNDANLNFDICRELPIDYKTSISKIKDADIVIFVGGISSLLEGEEMPVAQPGFKGGDRTDIELPNVQRETMKALKAAGKKVIFVNCSGSAMGLVPETQSCDAILQAWYPGEEGGTAVADVLFGDYNPSGKLPVTFYKSVKQLPDFENYSMKGRTYRYMSDPLFQFGFGLSYTKFKIGKATIIDNGSSSKDITVPVKNIGKCKGTEVVQIYVRKVGDVNGPLKSLRGFQRVEIPAGKSQSVTIKLPKSAFEFFDSQTNTMRVTPGEYDVLYGNSSADADLQQIRVTI